MVKEENEELDVWQCQHSTGASMKYSYWQGKKAKPWNIYDNLINTLAHGTEVSHWKQDESKLTAYQPVLHVPK